MYDSFDMACNDEETALRLNIKVNSENLLPTTPQKYNIGSLRLPADPSWPKIPQRRLSDDVNDPVQPPCIATLTGTPRRSRSIVRIPQSQSCTSRHCCGKIAHQQTQLPKRRSGCIDPRFKKVTTVKSQMTSTESGDHEIDRKLETDCSISKEFKALEDKTLPWKDVNRARVMKQEAEKPDETKGTESIGIQTVQTISTEIRADINEQKTNIFIESSKQNFGVDELSGGSRSPVKSPRKQVKPEIPRDLKNDASFGIDLKKPAEAGTDDRNRSLLPQLSGAPIPEFFQSIPLFKNIEIPRLELPNNAAPQFLNFGNREGKTFSNHMKKDSRTLEACNINSASPQRESNLDYALKEANIIGRSENNEDHKLQFKTSPEKSMKNIHNEEKCRPQQIVKNVYQKSLPKHNFHINCDQDEPLEFFHTNKNEELLQQFHGTNDPGSAKFFYRIDDRCNDENHKANEYGNWGVDYKDKTVPCFRQRRKMKSEHHLMLDKKRLQSSEPQITVSDEKGGESWRPYLKEANSFVSKHLQQLIPDFLPKTNFNDFIEKNVKREHCVKPYERPSNKIGRIFSSLDFGRQNLSPNKTSPGAETDTTTENPAAIPVKTQELLNKSYWEYYRKLKLNRFENGESPQEQYFCQVAMGAPKSKRRRAPELIVEESNNNSSQTEDQVELSLPEIRTLEQCSVLSTMINKTLDSALKPSTETIKMKQIYLNGNMRSSSDPTAGTQSAILKRLFPGENDDSILSSTPIYREKFKRDGNLNSKTSRLKSIGEHPVVFFGCMVYAMIVFLPMIYDYFSYEEHDEYEDMSYAEIAFEYIIASFKEALGEFFDMMNKIFFKPRSCRKCNNLS